MKMEIMIAAKIVYVYLKVRSKLNNCSSEVENY
jgi:hypothetical protein